METIPYNLWPSDEIKASERMESSLTEVRKKLYGIDREEIPA
jgi:hypothetical protein